MRLPRMTTRKWMAVTAVVAVLAWLAAVAEHVLHDTQTAWVFHVWERRGSIDPGGVFGTQHRAPFWPRYWRRLLGRLWPGTYDCDHSADENIKYARLATTVSFASEELERPGRSNSRLPASHYANRGFAAYHYEYVPTHWKQDEDGIWESDYR